MSAWERKPRIEICCRDIEAKRKRLQELVAAQAIDSDAALQRLRDAEMRLRADITAAESSNTAARARLIEANDPDFRKLQALQDAAAKRSRKRDEMEAKAARLRTKIATAQVRCLLDPLWLQNCSQAGRAW